MRSLLLLLIVVVALSCTKEEKEPWEPCFFEDSYAVEDAGYTLHLQGWGGGVCSTPEESSFALTFMNDSIYTFEHVLYLEDCDSLSHVESGKVQYEYCEFMGRIGSGHSGNMTFIPSSLNRENYTFQFQRDGNYGLKLDRFTVYDFGPTTIIFNP